MYLHKLDETIVFQIILELGGASKPYKLFLEAANIQLFGYIIVYL